MRRRDAETPRRRRGAAQRRFVPCTIAEGVESTPSDALPLSLFPSPSFTITLNYLPELPCQFFTRLSMYFSSSKTYPFLFVRFIKGNTRISDIATFSFLSSRGYIGLFPLSPSSVLSPSHFYIIAILVGSPSPLLAFVYTRLSPSLVPSSNPRAS